MNKAEKIEDVAKRRGFFWLSSEIYGGISGLYDYAHLGKALKNKWEKTWKDFFLSLSDDFYEIESCNIMPEQVFIASGHLENFVDPVVKCKKCGSYNRADHILEEELKQNFEGLSPQEMAKIIKEHNIKCPKCKGPLEEVGILNMMFPIRIGTDKPINAYLRPETAQGPYVNFKQEFNCLRKKLPIGLAIIGKAFRNEISPRNLLIRMREFTQAELQIFFDPDAINEHEKFPEVENYKLMLKPHTEKEAEISCKDAVAKLKLPKFYVYHMAKIQQFYLDILKIPKELLRFRELSEEERAFYNKYHWDIELKLESLGGFKEVAGLHYRTDHDLGGHQKISKQDMSVNIEGKKFVPHVLELSFGVDRNIYALFELAYEEEERTVLKFPRSLSPFDCALFPLVNKDGIPEKAQEIRKMLKQFSLFYDDSGSIGRRYRRMDEIGVACCITVDHQSVEDKTVTIRDRDSMKQVRVKIENLPRKILLFLEGTDLEKLGE